MHTAQLLTKLMNSVINNSAIMSSLPMEDIRLCVLAELKERSALYPAEQFQSLEQDFLQIIAAIQESATSYQLDTLLHYMEELIVMLQTLPDSEYTNQQLLQARFNQVCLEHYQQDTIIVLGDSHVNFFSGNELLHFEPIGQDINICPSQTTLPFTALHLGPCLAYQCNNYESTSQFRTKIDYLTQHFIKPNATIVCCLGEIDMRVHVFQQTDKQNKSYEEIVDAILEQYISFLCSLQTKGYQVYCWGPIATQKDACPVDPNFPRIGSEVMRNKATAYCTKRLYALCAQHGIGFLSIFPQMVTAEYETLEQYLSADKCHLGQAAMPLAIEEFRKINHPTLQCSLP